MRTLSSLLLLALLAGCGAYETRSTGIDEQTTLVVRSESLVGATVAIDDGFSMVVSEENLTKYTMGVLGAADRENEKLETITISIDPGTHRVRVSRGGNVLADKQLHFTQGQTRELRVRQ
jgi:hypothetical protein